MMMHKVGIWLFDNYVINCNISWSAETTGRNIRAKEAELNFRNICRIDGDFSPSSNAYIFAVLIISQWSLDPFYKIIPAIVTFDNKSKIAVSISERFGGYDDSAFTFPLISVLDYAICICGIANFKRFKCNTAKIKGSLFSCVCVSVIISIDNGKII